MLGINRHIFAAYVKASSLSFSQYTHTHMSVCVYIYTYIYIYIYIYILLLPSASCATESPRRLCVVVAFCYIITSYIAIQEVEERTSRKNPYHNPAHCADVARFMNALLTRGGIERFAGPVATFAAIFACIVHDFEHPGLTNDFLVSWTRMKINVHIHMCFLHRHKPLTGSMTWYIRDLGFLSRCSV